MIVNATITGADIAAATVTNANLVKSGSVLGSTLVSLGATVTTVTGLSSVTSDVFAVNGDTGYLGVNSISKTFADSFTIVANTASQVALTVATGTNPCTSVHIKYTLYDAGYTNLRAGSIIIASDAVNSGTNANIAETSTQDIGDTSLIDFTATVSGTAVRLVADSTGFNSNNSFRFEYTLM